MKSKSKTGVRQIIFLPAALMLVLLPVAAYLAFATFSDNYMKKMRGGTHGFIYFGYRSRG